jgi:hypothetical protein
MTSWHPFALGSTHPVPPPSSPVPASATPPELEPPPLELSSPAPASVPPELDPAPLEVELPPLELEPAPLLELELAPLEVELPPLELEPAPLEVELPLLVLEPSPLELELTPELEPPPLELELDPSPPELELLDVDPELDESSPPELELAAPELDEVPGSGSSKGTSRWVLRPSSAAHAANRDAPVMAANPMKNADAKWRRLRFIVCAPIRASSYRTLVVPARRQARQVAGVYVPTRRFPDSREPLFHLVHLDVSAIHSTTSSCRS